MCEECGSFSEPIPIRSPEQYFDLLARVRRTIADGKLCLMAGNVELDSIAAGRPWPRDLVEHVFACTGCGQRFRLAVETYHGSGGSWKPLSG